VDDAVVTAQRRLFSACGALAILAATLTLPAVTRAADPQPEPTPVVLHLPHYLVFMESHDTYNGPVVDGVYWLYPYLPDGDAGTHFAVPDGNDGVWHYTGSVVGGPFTTDAEACPAMLAVGVQSLTAWVTMAGEQQLVVDCTRFAATPEPSAVESTTEPATSDQPIPTEEPGVSSAPEGAQAQGSEPTEDEIGLAVAIIGLLLFGGGAAGVVVGRSGPKVMEPPPAGLPAETEDPTSEPERDPCAEQAAAVEMASLKGRYVNHLLAQSRAYEAILQAEIDRLANLVLPGSVLLDLGFAAGGISGGASRAVIATAGWKKFAEAVGKDLIKQLAKQALGNDLALGALANEGDLSSRKAAVLELLERSVVNRRFFGEFSPIPGQIVPVRDLAAYSTFRTTLEKYGANVAEPIANAIGSMLDLYSGAIDGIALKRKLDHLRATRDRILDMQAEMEIELEDAIGAHQFAADRLAHCREINAPGWRPE
jgi:hypothetical protein